MEWPHDTCAAIALEGSPGRNRVAENYLAILDNGSKYPRQSRRLYGFGP